VKSQKLSRSQFSSQLLAYSATAGAALLAAPAANATIQNLTEFSLNGGSSFSATPPGESNGRRAPFSAASPGLIVGLRQGFVCSNFPGDEAYGICMGFLPR
jgi:hypothetical protein